MSYPELIFFDWRAVLRYKPIQSPYVKHADPSSAKNNFRGYFRCGDADPCIYPAHADELTNFVLTCSARRQCRITYVR